MSLTFPKFRLLDLSVSLANTPHADPPRLGPEIDYLDRHLGASDLLKIFPGTFGAWGVSSSRAP